MSAAHCPCSYLNRRNRRDGTTIQDGIFDGTANTAIIWRDLAGLGGGALSDPVKTSPEGDVNTLLRAWRGSRKAQVVELRFFGGLSAEETAEVLKVSPVTVMRDWSTARAWLYREMSGGARDGC